MLVASFRECTRLLPIGAGAVEFAIRTAENPSGAFLYSDRLDLLVTLDAKAGHLRFLDVTNPTGPKTTAAVAKRPITALAMNASHTVVTTYSSANGKVKLVDIEKRQVFQRFKATAHPMADVRLSVNNFLVCVATTYEVSMYELLGKNTKTFSHASPSRDFAAALLCLLTTQRLNYLSGLFSISLVFISPFPNFCLTHSHL